MSSMNIKNNIHTILTIPIYGHQYNVSINKFKYLGFIKFKSWQWFLINI